MSCLSRVLTNHFFKPLFFSSPPFVPDFHKFCLLLGLVLLSTSSVSYLFFLSSVSSFLVPCPHVVGTGTVRGRVFSSYRGMTGSVFEASDCKSQGEIRLGLGGILRTLNDPKISM